MIDTTATEPPRNWFLELTSTPTEDLLRHADHLRAKLAHAQERGHRVDARAYELRLLDVERAIAVHNRRATEAEDQRAAVQRPTLTEERVREVVKDSFCEVEHLCGHPDAWRVAARAAKELAGAVVSEEQRDRIVTIADEAFGLGPVEPMDETLTRIERGIFEQHKRLANLEVQREGDLREAYRAGWLAGENSVYEGNGYEPVSQPTGPADERAAEYARSKAGG